jgi:hypothetical protein
MLQRLTGWLQPFVPQAFQSRQPFAAEDCFRQSSAGTTAPRRWTPDAQTGAGRLWLLARSCYVVRVVDLSSVPVPKRDAAISLALSAWSPFAESGQYIIPQANGVILCAWDWQIVEREMRQFGLERSGSGVQVLPESAVRLWGGAATGKLGPSTGSKLRLVTCLDGFVGQLFRGEQLLAEQWWPQKPSHVEWQNFARSVGVSDISAIDLDAPSEPAWARNAAGYAADRGTQIASGNEVLGLMIAAWLLAIGTIWYANEAWQVLSLKNEAAQKLTATEKDLDVTLKARSQALASQERAVQLAKLFEQPDVLQLFAVTNDVLTQIGAAGTLQLAEWEMRANSLKFALVATGSTPPPATTLVKAFETVQRLRDVEAAVDGSRINISARIVSPEETDAKTPVQKPAGAAP